VKPWILALVATSTSIAAVAACSSGSHPSYSGGDGGGGDGGSGGEGGGSSSGGHLPYFGTMTAAKASASTPIFTITGAFAAVGDAGGIVDASAASLCPGTYSGSCCYVPPAAGDAGLIDAGAIGLVSAGTITITDNTTPIAALNPGSNGGYGITSANNNPSVKWQPGDTLTFSASGSVVEAFQGNLPTMQDFAGVTPALSYTTASTVPLNADFVVKWTPGNGTTVRLFVDALKGSAQAGVFTCDVPDSSGTVSVPAALLSHLAAGDTGIATLTRGALTAVTGGNANVGLISTVTTGGTLKFQ
jgi:hypothetical protein